MNSSFITSRPCHFHSLFYTKVYIFNYVKRGTYICQSRFNGDIVLVHFMHQHDKDNSQTVKHYVHCLSHPLKERHSDFSLH